MRLTGLQTRFTGRVVLGATWFALCAGGVTYELTFRQSLQSGRAALTDMLTVAAQAAGLAAAGGDPVHLQRVADVVSRHPLVRSVVIESGPWSVHAGPQPDPLADPPALQQVLPDPARPDQALGHLRVEPDMVAVQHDARLRALMLTAMLILQVLLVAVLMFAAARRLITTPLAHLAGRLEGLHPGTSARVEVPALHRQDEIGSLVNSTNALLASTETAMAQERALRAEVQAMEARYRTIFDSSSAGIFVVGQDGRLINGNPTLMRIVGADQKRARELQGKDFFEAVFDEPKRVRQLIEHARETAQTTSADLLVRANNGNLRWVHCLISVQHSDQGLTVEGVLYDVSDRLAAERAARHQADHDALTDLLNRQAVDRMIDAHLRDPVAPGEPMSLLFIDLDGFKAVNDSVGHKAGDKVLRTCAARISAALQRENDGVARVGGDEFLIFMPGIAADDPYLSLAAGRIVEALQQPIPVAEGHRVVLGASVGLSSLPQHGTTRRALVQAADAAMYEVKRSGKNSYAMFLPGTMDFADTI